MNFPLFIAKRYLISKKSRNVINIISMISVIGVGIGTAALIVVLSVFNGLESLIVSLYNTFDPELKITKNEGKHFDQALLNSDKIKHWEGIDKITFVLEENALLKYRDQQYIVKVKGVSEGFEKMSGLDTMMTQGKLLLRDKGNEYAVIGQGVANNLNFDLRNFDRSMQIYVPKRGKIKPNSEDALNEAIINVDGVFANQIEFDAHYVIVPLSLEQSLLESENHISAIELSVKPGYKIEDVQNGLQNFIGKDYTVFNRFQQHEMFYKILKSEKLIIFLILAFILVIATFNIIGSLTMLIVEKKQDISIMHSMGTDVSALKRIFFFEGLMITVAGALAGLFLGFVVCLAQQVFGIIQLEGSGSFVVKAYPIHMQLTDFIYIFGTVLVIGFIAALIPAGQVVKGNLMNKVTA